MRDYRDSRRSDNRGRRDYSDRPTMHRAICDECGRECEVPFRPTGEKPVYCSECFEKRGNVSSRRSDRRDTRRSRFDDKQMYTAICDKCGRECEVPFRPTGDRPVFCSDCFEKKDHVARVENEKLTEQFDILNSKLDKILRALKQDVIQKSSKKKELIEKENAVKAAEIIEVKRSVKKAKKAKKSTRKVTAKKEKVARKKKE